ncbi:RNA-guided endonuclease TnpB family protein [Sphaerisporangium sp. NPDC088356]|uniref:RNA-guided endonuclease InsQ/TnpB family protein n=1 Tax=Sphaerisporangium sp. NPDC088356 TaxID=3154871 RepID=UPI0034317002
MHTAYKVRVYPTPEQAAVLNRTFGCVRLVWNRVLAWRQARYQAGGAKTSYAHTDRYLTELKRDPQFAFLFDASCVPLQQTLRHQYTAFVNFFAGRARYPRFKSRHGRQSATYTRSAFRWKDGRLHLAKMDSPVEFVWSWPGIDLATLAPSTVTVSREADGRWYASFTIQTAVEPERAPATGSAVGVDLGVKDFAVLSTGEKIANPRHLERRARNLARYQRRMARKRRGSANRAKAKAKVAGRKSNSRDTRALGRLTGDRNPLDADGVHLVVRHDHFVRPVVDHPVAESLGLEAAVAGVGDVQPVVVLVEHHAGLPAERAHRAKQDEPLEVAAPDLPPPVAPDLGEPLPGVLAEQDDVVGARPEGGGVGLLVLVGDEAQAHGFDVAHAARRQVSPSYSANRR